MSGILTVLAAMAKAVGNAQSFTTNPSSLASDHATLNSDGTVSADGGASGGWYSLTQAGIGASFWCLCTRTAGTAPAGSSSNGTTWLSLSSGPAWSLTSPVGVVKSCNLTVQIATDAAGTNIVATGYISLIADNSLA